MNWCKANGICIAYIQPGKPTQNAFVERFNRSLRNEVLNLYLFRNLKQVREQVDLWKTQYNEQRPHDALGIYRPASTRPENWKTPVLNCPLDGEAYNLTGKLTG